MKIKGQQKGILQIGKKPEPSGRIDTSNRNMGIKIESVKDGILTTKQYGEIEDLSGEAIYNNLVKHASPIFMAWRSFNTSAFMSFVYILNNNSNDCSAPKSVIRDINMGSGIINPNKKLIEYTEEIAKSIIRCWNKGKKVVCIPLSITQANKKKPSGYSHHANMLIFNTWRMEAEHFEPHGDFFKGTFNPQGVRKKVQGVNLTNGIKEINKALVIILNRDYQDTAVNNRYELKKGFKYLPPHDTCPTDFNGLKGFQSRDSYKEKETSKRTFDGVVITEQAGYCQMWSFFFMDLRLKTLRTKSTDIYREILGLFKRDYDDPAKRKEFIFLMRGMSVFAWKYQLKMVDAGLITREELVDVLGVRNNTSIEKYKNAVRDYMRDEWGKLTT